MHNSTLKRPTCKCGCGKPPTLSFGGYSYNCAPEEIKLKVGNKRNAAQKRKNERLSIARKAMVLPENLEMLNKAKELKEWFAHRIIYCEPVCQNCGAVGFFLKEEKYEKLWKSCQAHLLPKRHFHSIEAHPLNGMVLGSGFSGLCHCHDDYDHDWERASEMPIWNEVVRRFKILYPIIDKAEYRFIPSVLLKEIPNE